MMVHNLMKQFVNLGELDPANCYLTILIVSIHKYICTYNAPLQSDLFNRDPELLFAGYQIYFDEGFEFE